VSEDAGVEPRTEIPVMGSRTRFKFVMFLYFLSTGRIQASAEQVPSQDTGEVEDHAQGKNRYRYRYVLDG
jgi:hypothetical protein